MKVNEIILSSSTLQRAEFKSEQIKNIIFSRVPLQLCTIENSNLIPLNDGFRQQSQTQTITSVDQKVKQLHLGFLEEHLSNYNNKIFVVGIIGKQSSGKSYLLNRVFGTRFSVSSARCTDGVWGSIAYVEDQTFLVLDCEGLFNGARSDNEEIKMLAFLTAICDITILNSDLTFNRHFNILFNHLVEASKQLNDEKLFKGILYFVLRDVSSTDNSGAEQELLKNLERLKESGSEEIIFLKRLFNNKIAVESMVNYELKKFDEQIVSVRNYILQKSTISNHWNCGRELIQIMKILLCQLELSDNTNVSLIDLQILIEKIFEDSKELWYDFSSNEVQVNSLKLVQSDYKFPKFEEYQHILFNKDLLKQLTSNLITEDTIQTHNKNLFQLRTQFNLMMEQRKEQIIQKTLLETNRINNEEVKEIIEKNMSILKIFLTDQIKQYQFCEDKCIECHLQCKQFKNHIEISQTLMDKLDGNINNLEVQQKNSKIKNKSEEEEKRERIDQIKEVIKKAEYTLEGLTIQNKIIEIKEKLSIEKDAMSNYDFYDSIGECININVFQFTQLQNEKSQTATLEYLDNLQNLFIKEIPFLKNNKEQNNEQIKHQTAQYEQLNEDLFQYKEDIKQIEINQEVLQNKKQQISEQKLSLIDNFQSVQSQMSKLQIVGDETSIPNLQFNVEDENKKLIEIQEELQNQQIIYEQNHEELRGLLNMQENQQILYLEQLEQDINQFLEKQNYVDEEIEALKKKKRDLEDLRSQLQKEQSKKMGKNNNKILELNQKLKGLDEKLIYDQLQQCEIRQKDLEKHFINFENSELYNKCIEEIEQDQLQDQIDNRQIEQQDISIQTNQNEIDMQHFLTQSQQDDDCETQSQQQETFEKERKLKIMNLFLKKKEEKVTQCSVKIHSLQEQTENRKKKIETINKRIQEIMGLNKLIDSSKFYQSEICEYEKKLEVLHCQLSIGTENLYKKKQNQESTINKLDQLKKNNIELENKNVQIEEQINNLNLRLDQIKIFQENLSEYTVLNATLQEEEYKLKKLEEFQYVKDLQESEVQSKIIGLEQQIFSFKEEKDQLSNQLSTFNQFGLLVQNLRDLQDLKKQLVELKFEVHSCQRESHKCDQNCKICSDKKCDHKAGHQEKEEHLCNKQDHRCQDLCQMLNCQRNCMKSFKHDLQHKCENDHPCQEKCQYCDKKCKKDRSDPHQTTHDCQENSCTHKCKLCSRRCCEPHKHSLEKDNHFCENVHYCQELCQEDGICKLEYEVIQATWKTELSEFQYTKYIPKDNGKQICQKQIPVRSQKHDGKHLCKEKTEKQFHLCNQQCPECNTYCDLKYGHGGHHSSDRHRNKENQIFTTQQGNLDNIKIQDQKETTIRQYQIGESSAPETCEKSCKRRGRAHFHLVRCQGGRLCLEKKGEYQARHSNEKYVNFEHLNFDEVLCLDFWKLNNWVHPIQNELDNITKCNYFCPLCVQQTVNYQFCENNAWHTKDDKISAHSFSCVETHLQNQIKGINVTFVIDSTLSMGKYIVMCKTTINDIMQKSKAYQNINGQRIEINFAAVSFKDHKTPYDESQKIIDIQDFSSDDVIISFLDKIVLEDGIDYPEAVLDGLDATLRLKWNPNYEKLLYLIADSPPHGKQYNNYNDNFPEGCPCGLKQENIFRTLQNLKVQFKILKLNQHIDMMIAEFKKEYQDLSVLTPNQTDEVTFKNLIVSDVCKFLVHNEITYQMKK